MSCRSLTEAASNLDVEIGVARYVTRALRLILFDLDGEGLSSDARRAAAELAFTVEGKLEEMRESFDITEQYRRAGSPPPVEAGALMRAPAFLLHAWRLRRIRWAMAALRRRLEAYEAAYGQAPVLLGD